MHTCICTHLYLRERRERGRRADLEPPAGSLGFCAHGGCCEDARLLPFVLSCWFAASLHFQPFRPDTSFITWGRAPEESNILTAFALSSHLAEGLAPRGVSLGAPSRQPLAWLPPRWGPGSERPCPPYSTWAPGLTGRPPGFGSSPVAPRVALDPPTPVAQCPPHRGGCEGSEDSPCEDTRHQCSVNISPAVIGGSAAVRTQE